MKFFLLNIAVCIIIFILLIETHAAIIINEIMPNPATDEALNEWVELYNNESIAINVSGWSIGDNADNDSIEGGLYNKEGTIIAPLGFAIVTADATRAYNNFNASSDAVKLYSNDNSIGNGLSNSEDVIYIYDNNNNLIDKKEYHSTTEGFSWAFANNSLHQSSPTPGFANDAVSYENCDYQVNVILPKSIFDSSSEFLFKMAASRIKGMPTNFTAKAKIEDINGVLIKSYAPFTNDSITNQRTSADYKPNLEEGKSYILTSNMSVQCNDINLLNNYDAKFMIIKKLLQENSFLGIMDVYDLSKDDTAKFGQMLRVNLNAYRGSTDKETVSLWLEDKKGNKISKQSKAALSSKYTNYSLVLPIQISPNCNGEFDDGSYIIMAEGISAKDDKKISLEGLTDALCKIEKSENKKPKVFSFSLQDFNESIAAGESFISKVILDNNGNKDIDIKVWSYVYSNAKSFSGDEEKNKKEFTLKANSLQVVELENKVDADTNAGKYKFKVAVNKDNQKTNEELIKDAVVITEDEDSLSAANKNIRSNMQDNIQNNLPLNKVIYESTTEKTKKLTALILISLSVLLNIVLIWKR